MDKRKREAFKKKLIDKRKREAYKERGKWINENKLTNSPCSTGRNAEALEAGVQVPEEGALLVEGGRRLGEEMLDANCSREP